MHKVQALIQEIKKLEDELLLEVEKQQDQFSYQLNDNGVLFDKETQTKHKAEAQNILKYIYEAPIKNILTLPIIWFGLIPALFMDLFASIYQAICFKVYGIPKVNRSDYIVIDRQNLRYLNGIERLNCIYCGYFNGVTSYTQEIAARSEQYWCPIKHAKKTKSTHRHYHSFVEYGDYEDYQDKLIKIRKQLELLDK